MTAAFAMQGVTAMQNLRAAEERYLVAFGWRKADNGTWSPPCDTPWLFGSTFDHDKAVYKQKCMSVTSLRSRGRLPDHLTFDDKGNWYEKPRVGASGVDFTNSMFTRMSKA